MSSKTKNVAVAIKSIEFTNTGELVIVAQPNELNPKGTYIMNEAQEQRLLKRVGLRTAEALKHLVALSNGTSKLNYIASYNVAGEVWDNGKVNKDGAPLPGFKTGTYEKDWIGLNNHEIELGFAAKMKMAEIALQQDFAMGVNRGTSPRRATQVAEPAMTAEAQVAEEQDEPTV